ncbi:Lipid phosphate phosphatase 1 [Lachnellula arida]|uniref:Lipid phosphate phosphatase 1 n=1 Tax=Lachnellula arida TaxID=1316785 RepID=A0A8T9BAP3_9HELO|nr:Lipid phosphate phosphatase 1 [Lachnellula arida]
MSAGDPPLRIRQEPVAPLNFSHYLQIIWADYTSISILALLTVGIWIAPMYYVECRVVPLWPSGFGSSINDLRPPILLDYPRVPEPLPSWSCGFVIICVPLLVVSAFQIQTRRLWDLHTGVIGLLKAVLTTTFVVTILKQFIGGFRPHFIDVCKPDMSRAFKEIGKELYWLNATACTGAPYDVKKSMQSFPSGHTANSFAAAIFTSLFLNAQLKVIADHASTIWALTATIAPLVGASLIAGSVYMSHQHHADDVVFGIIIGLSIGIFSFRSRYTAVLDFRFNHIPLPPHTTYTTTFFTQALSWKAEDNVAEGSPAQGADMAGWSRCEATDQRTSWMRNTNRFKVEQ